MQPHCFEVLCGSKPASTLVGKITNFSKEDAAYIQNECDWTIAQSWANWWTRPSHLEMLTKTIQKWMILYGKSVQEIQMQLKEKTEILKIVYQIHSEVQWSIFTN